MIELFKAVLFGIVEGITEWLPISSTGHMIILDHLIQLNMSAAFKEMFLVVIQLGAILSVVVLYFWDLFPWDPAKHYRLVWPKLWLWFKIIVATVPAAIIGILFDDQINRLFYHDVPVAIALILFGVFFLVVEEKNQGKIPRIERLSQLGYREAFLIGLFQVLAAVFPGTSRSGATILGGILIGTSRTVAAEFTFFLAIPVMFGASLLKMLKFGWHFTALEGGVLFVGMVVSFLVSILAIRFLLRYIKKHDFKLFGWYRIGLGILVLLFSFFWH